MYKQNVLLMLFVGLMWIDMDAKTMEDKEVGFSLSIFLVRSDFYRFVSADASLLRGYPRYAPKYSLRTKLLSKTSIDRRWPIHSNEV